MIAFRFCLRAFVALFFSLAAFAGMTATASAQSSSHYDMQEIIDAGHGFFGSTSGGLAKLVEKAFQSTLFQNLADAAQVPILFILEELRDFRLG